jgi:hypothetical protein
MIDVIPTDYCRSEPLLRLTATGEPEFGQTFNGNLLQWHPPMQVYRYRYDQVPGVHKGKNGRCASYVLTASTNTIQPSMKLRRMLPEFNIGEGNSLQQQLFPSARYSTPE